MRMLILAHAHILTILHRLTVSLGLHVILTFVLIGVSVAHFLSPGPDIFIDLLVRLLTRYEASSTLHPRMPMVDCGCVWSINPTGSSLCAGDIVQGAALDPP